jgi:hypothetical protein
MSDAERQARHRAKRKAEFERLRELAGANETVTLRSADHELIEARAEIDRLRKELIAARKPPPLPETAEEMLAQQKVFREEQKAKRAAKRAADKALAAELYADDDKPTLQEKLKRAEHLLAARNILIKNLQMKVRCFENSSPPRMSKRLHRQVLGWLHPDRAHGDDGQRKILERCFQDFSSIKFTFPPDDEGDN